MNLQFKKIILLTMQMNDTKHLKLKVTTQMVVNLELFTRVRVFIIIRDHFKHC